MPSAGSPNTQTRWAATVLALPCPVTALAETWRRSCVRSSAAISHQALIYPATDATRSAPSIREHAMGPMLTRADIDAFLDHYLGPDGLSTTDPLISPLWAASHANLPPALVQTADLDPLRDEGRMYAERLSAAGVVVRHTNYVGVPHGFASFPGATTIGRQHRAELVGELRRHLHP